MTAIDRTKLKTLQQREESRFLADHPKSAALYNRAQSSLLGGVPMNWMRKWAGAFPVFVERAQGAHFADVDGLEYVDLCLGDTGAMTGHSPPVVAEAIARRVREGITLMLPTEDSLWVGEELRRRFGLPFWQFTLTATDANRFAIRIAREITQRSKILVFNFCYHGTVDESFATIIDPTTNAVGPRRGNIGPPVNPAETTRVVEFNDLPALEAALADQQVAAVLMEPALTNVGIVLPEPGYLDGVRRLTAESGTLLIVDETHTICAGPGGATATWGLQPDMLVIGKTIGGGIPAGTYGFTEEVGDRVSAGIELEDSDVGGIGGTLAGYALSMAAVRATLTEVMTPKAYDHMIPLAERWAAGVEGALEARSVPWHVTRLGCRAEYHFMPTRPRNGSEQYAHGDFELERFLHLYALNRGILLTPFHNMALMSPATTEADVDRHTQVFSAALDELF